VFGVRLEGVIDRAALWNLDNACQELHLGISCAHAARIFQIHTGQGVKEYAKKKRLLKAVEQLIAKDLPVKAIANELGYQRAFHLSRAFRKQFGLTPTKYRSANRLKGISQQAS
jgi:AraC-like DNA-binding protein